MNYQRFLSVWYVSLKREFVISCDAESLFKDIILHLEISN